MFSIGNDELIYRSCAYGRAMTEGKKECSYAAMRGRRAQNKEALASR